MLYLVNYTQRFPLYIFVDTYTKGKKLLLLIFIEDILKCLKEIPAIKDLPIEKCEFSAIFDRNW